MIIKGEASEKLHRSNSATVSVYQPNEIINTVGPDYVKTGERFVQFIEIFPIGRNTVNRHSFSLAELEKFLFGQKISGFFIRRKLIHAEFHLAEILHYVRSDISITFNSIEKNLVLVKVMIGR
jgi:hypothetical protein